LGFHHLAVVTRDSVANDLFYTHAMGFELIKVEVAPTPDGGWAKHFFYDTGGNGLMAFWELHDETIGDDYSTALSEGFGLPPWVNHIAFDASDLDDLEARKKRWLEHGYGVLEIDHHWCYSIYTMDPNGTMVEFCVTTGEFDEQDRRFAREMVTAKEPKLNPKEPLIKQHKTEVEPIHKRGAPRG